ncbi:hypothetical protein AADZ90_007240 [Aestuariibius sp. 2305UL40-4]|uniref:hypothetical protein n=1 Tax=Aestuariibius violaceus TaxID=3234132 RepID=UPI00345E9048
MTASETLQLADIVHALDPERLGVPGLTDLWPRVAQSERLRRIIAEGIADGIELTCLTAPVAQLIEVGPHRLHDVTSYAGAAAHAPALRRLIRKHVVAALKAEIGADAYGFALTMEAENSARRQTTPAAKDILADGRALFASWFAGITAGEQALLDLALDPVLPGDRAPDASPTLLPQAIEAVHATI